jgi:integrase
MTLNAREVETAKPRDKAYKLADGGGLYLVVNTNGSRYWRMRYRFAGKEKKHYPFLAAAELPEFLQKLSNYSGSLITLLATRLLMLTGLRTVELRLAEWSEIDFDNRIWEIPITGMKMKRPHVIPLSTQSLSIFVNWKN